MEGPPSKRAKRSEDAAGREREYTRSPRSPRPHDSRREDHGRSHYDEGRKQRPDNDRRRRSKSPRTDRKQERSRSRDRPQRERERREVNGHRRERSRSRDRHYPSKEHQSSRRERRHSRSRSPVKNGDDRSFRNRSPIQPSRSDHDRQRALDRDKKAAPEVKPRDKTEPDKGKRPEIGGDVMAVDEDDEDAQLRKMMGFTSFKTTHNTKVPGNQIYGVRKEKKTQYRQYMNRVGGFNRPLSPSRV